MSIQEAQEAGAVAVEGPWPTIGRIVHYTNLGDADGRYPPEAQAAIVTAVNETNEPGTEGPFVSLHIFYRTGDFYMNDVPFSPYPMVRGHWNWPPLKSMAQELTEARGRFEEAARAVK